MHDLKIVESPLVVALSEQDSRQKITAGTPKTPLLNYAVLVRMKLMQLLIAPWNAYYAIYVKLA